MPANLLGNATAVLRGSCLLSQIGNDTGRVVSLPLRYSASTGKEDARSGLGLSFAW